MRVHLKGIHTVTSKGRTYHYAGGVVLGLSEAGFA
jgi:hypothetical protein